jgi:hypothetical protein
MAKDVLSRSIPKRWKTDPREVELYAGLMRAGLWEPLKQDLPVSIGNTGQLADGYHRLNAVIAFGEPVEIIVNDTRPKHLRWPGETVERHEFYRPGKPLIPSAKPPERGGAGEAGREHQVPTCPVCWWPGGSEEAVEAHVSHVHKEVAA